MESKIGKELHPGEDVSTLYYSDRNVDKQREDVVFDNKFVQPFNSLNFGAQGLALVIPNDKFVSEVIVSMKFPGGANLAVTPAVAYDAIQAVEWQVFGSTVYRKEGVQHMLETLNNCESNEKKDEIIQLAGGAGGAIAADAWYHAHISVPWSNIRAIMRKKPIDSTLGTQPIRIVLYLRNNTDLYYATTGTPTIPTALVAGQFQIRQGQCMDRQHHLQLRTLEQGASGMEMKQNYYSYPFSFYQSFISPAFTGATSSPVTVNLTGFRKGELRSIIFGLYKSTELVSPATSARNIVKTSEPGNLELLFNGNQLYRAIADSWKLLHLEEDRIPNWMRTTVGSATRYYWLEMPMSQALPKASGDDYQSGIDLSNQTLQLNLTTPDTGTYYVYAIYVYNSTLLFDGQNAEAVF